MRTTASWRHVATFRGLSVFRPSSLPVSAKADPASAAESPAGPRRKEDGNAKVSRFVGARRVPAGARAGGGRVCWQQHDPDADPDPTPTPSIYAGKNSQGQKLGFAVVHTASGPKFDPIFTAMTVRCPVTGDVITIGFGFSGFRIPIKKGKFSLVLSDISDRFRWSGTVTFTKASGPESYAMPAFDNEGGLQKCSTGPLSWTAKAVTPGSSAAATRSTAYVIKFTKASDGSVHLSVTH
jgi:hypothetical protein